VQLSSGDNFTSARNSLDCGRAKKDSAGGETKKRLVTVAVDSRREWWERVRG